MTLIQLVARAKTTDRNLYLKHGPNSLPTGLYKSHWILSDYLLKHIFWHQERKKKSDGAAVLHSIGQGKFMSTVSMLSQANQLKNSDSNSYNKLWAVFLLDVCTWWVEFSNIGSKK